MYQLRKYIQDTLGIEVQPKPIPKQRLSNLPMYICETYKLNEVVLFNHRLLLAEPKYTDDFSIMQTGKHFDLLKKASDKKVVLVLPEITSIVRKRLIEKGINFIVPGKQLYLPDLLLDLKESFTNLHARPKKEALLPSAQFLLIYHIIHRNNSWKLDEHSFKEIAKKTGYTAMAITKAIDDLKYFKLIDVIGEKEKNIRFRLERNKLWPDLEKRELLVNPVLKRVFVDEKPKGIIMLHCYASALPEYTDMNPEKQEYFAIEKNVFYKLQKTNTLINPNENEGRYCLEIWKYSPKILVGELPNETPVVDPLSLYLSFKNSHDERFEMALEQIIEKYIW